MHGSAPKVSGGFFAPDRNDCLKAISCALLRIRSHGYSMASLGRELGCSEDTIANASNEKAMLQFDSIALLAFKFPEEFSLVEMLWNASATAPLSVADRLDRIERDTAAIRKEVRA